MAGLNKIILGGARQSPMLGGLPSGGSVPIGALLPSRPDAAYLAADGSQVDPKQYPALAAAGVLPYVPAADGSDAAGGSVATPGGSAGGGSRCLINVAGKLVSAGSSYYNGQNYAIVSVSTNNGASYTSPYFSLSNTTAFYTTCFAGGLYLFGGLNGYILCSTDLVSFSGYSSGLGFDIYGSTVANGTAYFVGSNGYIYQLGTSPRTIGGANLRGLAYFKGLFIAVGDGGRIVTSPDFTTWTTQTSPGGQLYGCAVLDGVVYAWSSGQIVYSKDGVNWLSVQCPDSGSYVLSLNKTASGLFFIMTGAQSGRLYCSPDLMRYTPLSYGTGNNQNDTSTGSAIAADGAFVFVSENNPTGWRYTQSKLLLPSVPKYYLKAA